MVLGDILRKKKEVSLFLRPVWSHVTFKNMIFAGVYKYYSYVSYSQTRTPAK